MCTKPMLFLIRIRTRFKMHTDCDCEEIGKPLTARDTDKNFRMEHRPWALVPCPHRAPHPALSLSRHIAV